MIRYLSLAFFAAVLAISAPALAQSTARAAADITGVWATGKKGGKVEIYQCGQALCGRVVDADILRTEPDRRDVHNKNKALRDRRLKGLVVLQNFTGGPLKWKGGPIYDAEKGEGAKRGSLELQSDGRLKVSGCFLFICRSQVWTRVK